MAVPSYTEDMTDISLADEASGWIEFAGGSFGEQGSPSYQDADYPYIQGSYAITQTCSKSKTLGSLGFDYGSTISLDTDGAFLVWQAFSSPFAIDDYAGTSTTYAGLMVLIGDDVNNFDVWEVGGKDKSPMPYGGWQCHAVNTTITADHQVGTKTIDRYVGAAIALTAYPSKGEPHQVDTIRFGRCTAQFSGGESANYATIAGFAAQNDSQSNRWGLLQEVAGGYLWQGQISLGLAGTAVDFRDSNETIFIKWNPKVTANFNTINVVNTSSNIEMDGFQFIVLDTTTASSGRWITTDATATVALTNCIFNDMSTFTFGSGTSATGCTWNRCDKIDPVSADISNASVLKSAVTGGGSVGGGAVYWNDTGDPNTKIDGAIFTKGAGSHHAIEFGTSAPQTINLTDMTFTDFSASNQQTTSVLYFPDTGADVSWTVSHTGTTGTISYYKARTGDTVTISSSVTVTVTVKDADGNLLQDVMVGIYKTSDRTAVGTAADTDVNGEWTTNYTGSTPVEVEIRCRKSSSADATKYKNFSSIQTIGTSGLDFAVTMIEDINNNATT